MYVCKCNALCTCSEMDIWFTLNAGYFWIQSEYQTWLQTNILWFDLMYGHFAIIVDCCNSSLLMVLSIRTLGWTGERWSWYSVKIRFFEWFARCIFRFETGVYVWLVLMQKKHHIWLLCILNEFSRHYLIWWIYSGSLINAVRCVSASCVGIIWIRSRIGLWLGIFPCINPILLTFIQTERVFFSKWMLVFACVFTYAHCALYIQIAWKAKNGCQ